MSDDAEHEAAEFAAGAGELIGEATEVAGPVGLAVGVAGAAGAFIGHEADELSGGAISGGIADGLYGLVGAEESYKAAQSFDDGEILDGVGHMASGAAHTIGHAAESAAHSVEHAVEGAYDSASDWLSEHNPFD